LEHMKRYVSVNDVKPTFNNGHYSYNLLDERNGCVNHCRTGLSVYTTADYRSPGIHDDQEGFFVLDGYGYAAIDHEEIRLEPNMSFIVPAGVEHSIKSDSDENPVRVFWFHSSIK
jgi:mannose-6-phosphate isomerase-like protein (cupin superfamily)